MLVFQTPACAAIFSPDGRHAVSAAGGERHVAVWSSVPAKKPKKAQSAAASLSLEDPAVQLDTCMISADDSRNSRNGFHVSAVSACGEAYVWSCMEEAEGSLGSTLLARIRVGDAPMKGYERSHPLR